MVGSLHGSCEQPNHDVTQNRFYFHFVCKASLNGPAVARGGSNDARPGLGLLAAEEAAALRSAFGQLRPEERDVLELRVLAGLSAEEVGAIMGKGAGAVRQAQSRALARLRDVMQEIYQ